MEIINKACGFYQLGQRANQEDSRFPDTDQPQAGQRFFIVCDGVGGLDKGEVASSTVAQALGEYMEHINLSEPFDANDFAYALGYAYSKLDAKNCGDSLGMATTLTFIAFHAGGAFVAHIGDSRIYQLRPEVGIVYRSQDHSLVNAMVTSGNLSPQQAINHPKSNVITRCMGGANPGEHAAATTLNITDIRPGDFFLLCSDGVLHNADDAALEWLISSNGSIQDKCRTLADMSRSSTDNNTAFLIEVEAVDGVSINDTPPAMGANDAEREAPAADEPQPSSQTTIIHPARQGIIEVDANNR